jgi:preprotein translocase subunit SecD
VKKKVILTGDSITGANSGFDSRDNKPTVSVRLGGGGIGLFKKTTMENIGKAMAVVYRETKVVEKVVDNAVKKEQITAEHIISVATIQSALGNHFQISGLKMEEARDLALLLRAGALPATISIVEEQIIGPSMGRDNIEKGVISGVVGLALVLIFMAAYYSIFGLIANLALLFNLVLLVAILSLIGATLTLPGIAGIVLTLGVAVDANVLIFERIREELRAGMTPKASINLGYDLAFATILDANLTTLIVGIILFALGSGPVKGFAVTLSIGILTSMFTAITGSRAIISALYENKTMKRIPVGI